MTFNRKKNSNFARCKAGQPCDGRPGHTHFHKEVINKTSKQTITPCN